MTSESVSLLDSIGQISLSTIRLATPLIFAALGGMISERSGVVNIALEGLMLFGAFTAAAFAHATGSPWAGAAAAGAVGGTVAMFYGIFVIRLRSDQIVAGTAINLLAAGATPFLCKVFFDSTSATPTLPPTAQFGFAPMITAFVIMGGLWFWLRKVSSGVWVRFAGENPDTLDAQGISVVWVRHSAVVASGVMAGLAGAALSIGLASGFSRGMTAGRGFMALAAMIFGKWMPIPTVLACLLFGLTEAAQIRLQGVVLWGSEAVPVQFIQILPYVITIIVLAGWVGQSRAPKSLGLPFHQP